MTLTPVGNRILIKRLVQAVEPKAGEFFLPTTDKKTGVQRAEVVKVGTKDIPEEIVPGVTVLVDYLGGELDIDGQKLFLLDVEHVIAVVS